MPKIPGRQIQNVGGVKSPSLTDPKQAGAKTRAIGNVMSTVFTTASEILNKNEKEAARDFVLSSRLEYNRRMQEVELELQSQYDEDDHAGYANAVADMSQEVEDEIFNKAPNALGQQTFVQAVAPTKERAVLGADLYERQKRSAFYREKVQDEMYYASELVRDSGNVAHAAEGHFAYNEILDSRVQEGALTPKDAEKLESESAAEFLTAAVDGSTNKHMYNKARAVVDGELMITRGLMKKVPPSKRQKLMELIDRREKAHLNELETAKNKATTRIRPAQKALTNRYLYDLTAEKDPKKRKKILRKASQSMRSTKIDSTDYLKLENFATNKADKRLSLHTRSKLGFQLATGLISPQKGLVEAHNSALDGHLNDMDFDRTIKVIETLGASTMKGGKITQEMDRDEIQGLMKKYDIISEDTEVVTTKLMDKLKQPHIESRTDALQELIYEKVESAPLYGLTAGEAEDQGRIVKKIALLEEKMRRAITKKQPLKKLEELKKFRDALILRYNFNKDGIKNYVEERRKNVGRKPN